MMILSIIFGPCSMSRARFIFVTILLYFIYIAYIYIYLHAHCASYQRRHTNLFMTLLVGVHNIMISMIDALKICVNHNSMNICASRRLGVYVRHNEFEFYHLVYRFYRTKSSKFKNLVQIMRGRDSPINSTKRNNN